LGNSLGRFQMLRQVDSIMDSIEAMAMDNSAIKQRMCMILELAPNMSKRYFMHGGRGVERTALLMLERVSRVHVRCALRHSDVLSAVPW